VEKAFQREVVDQPLRVKLWNVLKLFIWDDYDHGDYHKREKSILIDEMIRRLWFHYFNKDMDSLPEFADQYRKTGAYSQIKEFFFRYGIKTRYFYFSNSFGRSGDRQ